MPTSVDVDHFIPWARHPDDAIHNLVLAHRTCNNRKRDFLAAAPHVHRWGTRFDSALDEQLRQLASQERWPSHASRSRSVARAIYLRLPVDAKLWMRDRDFVGLDRGMIERALTATPARDTALAAEDEPPFDP